MTAYKSAKDGASFRPLPRLIKLVSVSGACQYGRTLVAKLSPALVRTIQEVTDIMGIAASEKVGADSDQTAFRPITKNLRKV